MLFALWGVFCWVVLGAAPGSVRRYRRGRRQVRRFARRCGAYRGRVVARQDGAGVFGGDPYWEDVVSLRRGAVAEVRGEIARAVESAVRDWERRAARRSSADGRSRPDVLTTVAPADDAHGWTSVSWHFRECRPPG
ncbi:hypothetical protein DN069_17880 [Streptacidiphilus pinicola]|uniref:Uncharacterized protein n=1 Tax=Streptacidiphilus pinicola TaxID=2219663 RepID=A0A2X0J9V0_9ACTN|nr:hypothetical protein [Streptacidiphilus pinicola]RAG84258.1 hypothetical protein DN069_17880 [Streptacidiphilus pinicola]